MFCRRLYLVAALASTLLGVAAAELKAQGGGPLSRLRNQTFGGGFSFSDEVNFRDWRIQRNAIIGHYRLVDPAGRRIMFGTFDECLKKLDDIKREKQLAPLPEDVVVVLHGLGAPHSYMNGICDYIEEKGGLMTVNVGYPSTMAEIDQHAATLDSVIRHLDGAKRISFVAHSMGNIVVRRYLYDMSRLTPEMRPNVEFKRMVMISPPNHGAVLADRLGDRQIVKMLGGKPVEELAPNKGWPELEKRLATPDFEFGIIAGGRGDDSGYLPSIPGDDDMLLSIDTMKLAGASDFIQTKGVHQFMPDYKEVRIAALQFLQHGYFVSADARRPILAANVPERP